MNQLTNRRIGHGSDRFWEDAIIRGKLVEAGYPTSIPIIPLIVVWGGPVSSTGSHSGSFVEGSHLDEWLIRYYDASEIELDKSLFRWIKADMRKSTFWLK